MSYFDISINLNMRCIEIQIHNKMAAAFATAIIK